jgi:hypothetical protein
MISSHAVNGTSAPATFSVIVLFGGKSGQALIDSGSIDSFMDYTFASKCACDIISTIYTKVRVAGGGQLDSNVVTASTQYFIQGEDFRDDFKLLPLKGYDLILRCDWIKEHSPIRLDLRDTSKQLTIYKQEAKKVIFQDFTALPDRSIINACKLEKMCRSDVMGYIIQINLLEQLEPVSQQSADSPDITEILDNLLTYFLIKLCYHHIGIVIIGSP